MTNTIHTVKIKNMLQIIEVNSKKIRIDGSLLKGKRHLTQDEIKILKQNRNRFTGDLWENFYVSEKEFDPSFIQDSSFDGFVIIGNLKNINLKFHDLELHAGIFNSYLKNTVLSDDIAIQNVNYLENYRIGSNSILFNIQEMCCTSHSKFGNGFIKENEPESNRIQIAVRNENEGRSVLPFESMLTTDAYIWSNFRDDKILLERFKELTENLNNPRETTFGTVGENTVIKNTTVIKDAKIGCNAYIKGAFKLKNITVLSSQEESSQIGEGVEMVNGIMGYGSRVFYQAVAVRFVIGKNCQLKYGARLLNSILGDNSTVSCCELLNNLIFPFHEQHHNSSFLIASMISGQSNIASGATIGSNHNSRSPDGEIIAGRGFWPGLCSDFKHNSRFASFVLVAKGSYQAELDILYPFSLVAPDKKSEKINIIPAWWYLYDMFAISRNNYKFKSRDKRKIKIQHIETNPLAPDTIQEVLFAIKRIINLTKEQFFSDKKKDSETAQKSDEELYQEAKDFLHKNEKFDFILHDDICQKKFGAQICKPVKAYKMYRKIVKFYVATILLRTKEFLKIPGTIQTLFNQILKYPLYTKWHNAGGQVIPEEKLTELFSLIKSKKINSWNEVHAFYDECENNYLLWQARYSLWLLEKLYSRKISDFTKEIIDDFVNDTQIVANDMYKSSLDSRRKDFTDYYRMMTYRNTDEMLNVLGKLENNDFLITLEKDTKEFIKNLKETFYEEQGNSILRQ